MSTYARLSAMVAIFLSYAAFASETEYVYFDFLNCKQLSIGSSTFPNDKEYKSLERQAEVWTQNHPRSPASVFQAGDYKSFGICLSVSSQDNTKGTYNRAIDSLICHEPSVNNFPLAGATYKLIKDKGALPSFVCEKGCNSVMPKMIHDLGYESPENWRNVEYERNQKLFHLKCDSKNRN